MGVLDIFFMIPLAWFAYKGFQKGLIIEVSSVVALLLGIFLSIYFSDVTAEFLKESLGMTTKHLKLVSFLVTFLLTVIAVSLLGKLLENMVKLTALGIVNQLGGIVFGLVKATIFLSFIVFFIEKSDKKKVVISTETAQSSFLYTYIKPLAPTVIDLFGNVDFSIDAEELRDKVLSVGD